MSQIAPMTKVRQKLPRNSSPTYLAYIRLCDCIICGKSAPSQAAHIRYPDMHYDKLNTGMQQKSDDKWTLPLCAWCHVDGPKAQHKMNERKFWKMHNIDPLEICVQLYAYNDDVDKMQALINEIRAFGGMG